MGINNTIALGVHAAVDTVSIALVSESGVLGEVTRAYDYAFIENLMDEITTFSGSLGVGVQDGASWGNMISEAPNELTNGVWWSLAGVVGFMFMIIYALNVVGDTLRDILDPKLLS